MGGNLKSPGFSFACGPVRYGLALWVLAAVGLSGLTAQPGRVLRAGPKDYRRRVHRLKAGETLHLKPGTYTRGLDLRGLHGSAGRPIRIRGGKSVIFTGRSGRNTVQLEDASWIVIEQLTLEGRGLQVDAIKAGGRKDRGVHHITIQGCTIRGHGADQMIVGISTKVPAWDWIIRGNRIEGAGTGLYLGDSNGSAPFVGGLIEGNVIRNPLGYCMQIKHQNARPPVPGMPVEKRVATIRWNVFIKNDVRGDAGDRPNLLVSGPPQEGPGAEDAYEIHGNLFFHNPRESLFQGAGRISLHDNVFVDCPGTAVRIQAHHGKRPLEVRIHHNTFLAVGTAWSVQGLPEDVEPLICANLVQADNLPARDRGNAWITKQEVGELLKQPRPPLEGMDVQPLRKILVRLPAGFTDAVSGDAAWNLDFYGRKRSRQDLCGAVSELYRRDRKLGERMRRAFTSPGGDGTRRGRQ